MNGLAKRAERFAAADDARRRGTRQGRFENSFLSTDMPDANGDTFDYGDCGRAARRMFREMDAPVVEHLRELRFWNALYKLRDYPELQKTLRAIQRYRVRQKIFSALKIKAETYRRRFFDLTRILEITI